MAENPFDMVMTTYKWRWVDLVHEVMGPDDPLTQYQQDILTDIQNGVRKISIRSGHGVRKTSTLAMAALCQHLTRFPARSVVTAPSSHQLFNAFWAELRKWHHHLPVALQDIFESQSDRFFHKSAPEDSYISARTAQPDKPESVAGVHAPHVLMIADEASGVINPALHAMMGSLTDPHATLCLAGNPLRATGLFYDTHNRLSADWKTYHISCVDNPVVSQDWVAEQRRMFGEESNIFRVRVLGEFPRAGDRTMIPVYLVESAQNRDVAPIEHAPWYWGLDVARFGDNATALCKRKGNVVADPVQQWRGLNTMQVVGRLHEEYYQTPVSERPQAIMVDVIGVGAGVVDRGRELKLPVVGVNVSESPSMGERFFNLRTELWWKAREWLEALDCRLPAEDMDLATQLPSVEYDFTSSGKIQLESKASMSKKGIASPDVADAFVLTFAGRAGRAAHGRRASPGNAQPLKRGLPTV